MAQALGGPSAYQRGPGHAKRIVNEWRIAWGNGAHGAHSLLERASCERELRVPGLIDLGIEDLGLVRKEGIGG